MPAAAAAVPAGAPYPALLAALARDEPTLLHLILDTEVSTTRSTLSAIRATALQRRHP